MPSNAHLKALPTHYACDACGVLKSIAQLTPRKQDRIARASARGAKCDDWRRTCGSDSRQQRWKGGVPLVHRIYILKT